MSSAIHEPAGTASNRRPSSSAVEPAEEERAAAAELFLEAGHTQR